MKKFKLQIILVLFACSVSYANGNGGYAGAFLRMGLGARSISLGNTGVAQTYSSYACFYNPAAYGFMEGKMVGLSHSFLSLDRRVNYISFAIKVPPGAGVSLGWIESGVGELKSINRNGDENGDINHSASAVYFSFGRRFSEQLAVGVSIKFLFEYLGNISRDSDYRSNGVGIDIGILYILNDRLTLGYQLKDLMSKLGANTTKIFERGGNTIDYFPLIHKIGFVYRTTLNWLNIYYDLEWSNKTDIKKIKLFRTFYDSEWSAQSGLKHHFGVEAFHGKNLALRFGSDCGTLTFGAGMDFTFLQTDSYLDYAFLPSIIDEGSSHIFSWQIKF